MVDQVLLDSQPLPSTFPAEEKSIPASVDHVCNLCCDTLSRASCDFYHGFRTSDGHSHCSSFSYFDLLHERNETKNLDPSNGARAHTVSSKVSWLGSDSLLFNGAFCGTP